MSTRNDRHDDWAIVIMLVLGVAFSLVLAILPSVLIGGVHHAEHTTAGATVMVISIIFGVIGFFASIMSLMLME